MLNYLIDMRKIYQSNGKTITLKEAFSTKKWGQQAKKFYANDKMLNYWNNVTSQMAKSSFWKRLFSQRNGDKKPSYSDQMANGLNYWNNVVSQIAKI